MKKHVIDFLTRGLMAASGGPIVMAIVYKLLAVNGVVTTLTADEVLLGVISTSLLAFFAAGVSIVHQMEQLPKVIATLIHAAVLYADYAIIYAVNGWISLDTLAIFTAIFAASYAAVWLITWLCVRASVNRLNRELN